MIFHPSIKTISKYLDGHLVEQKKTAVEDHLEVCKPCRKRVEFLNKAAAVFQDPDDELQQLSNGIMEKLDKKHNKTAVDYIGKIVSVTGSVLINNKVNDELQVAFQGISVVRGDTIITADDGKALLALEDGSCIYVNKSTELDFSNSKHTAVLERGEFFAMMKPQKTIFTVGTPAAVLNVIGTDFDTVVTDSRETILKVLKGEVQFCTGSHKVPVKRRRQVSTIINQAPVREKIRNPKSVKGWTNDMTSQKNGGNKGGMFKKLLAGLIAVIIALCIYYAFKAPQTRSIDSRVPANLSFEELYRLDEGEYLKAVWPPFIPERIEYYKREVPHQPNDIPATMYFKWENNQLNLTNRSHGSSPNIKNIMHTVTSLPVYRIAGDAGILEKQMDGDYIYRSGMNYEENPEALNALEDMISKGNNRNVRLEFREAPVKVMVMENHLKEDLAKGNKLNIEINSKYQETNTYSGSTSLSNMPMILGQIIDKGVINEAQVKSDISVTFRIKYSSDQVREDPQWLLDEFAAQTGYTFREEERTIRVLFIEPADSPETGQ
jgi:FecR protein/Putative zinc-finger